jgi:hypothetical protein
MAKKKRMKAPKEPGKTPEEFLIFMSFLGVSLMKCVKCGGEIWVKTGTKKPRHPDCKAYAAAVQKYGRLEKESKTYWLSFARPHENYVVITDAPTPDAAIAKAAPLKKFCPVHWSLQIFELAADAQELKDFQKDVLITDADLCAKGYKKSRAERIRQALMN